MWFGFASLPLQCSNTELITPYPNAGTQFSVIFVRASQVGSSRGGKHSRVMYERATIAAEGFQNLSQMCDSGLKAFLCNEPAQNPSPYAQYAADQSTVIFARARQEVPP